MTTTDTTLPTYFISHGGGPWPWMKREMGDAYAQLEASLADTTGVWGAATQAAAVVMNPTTGEVYSLVSIPTYDNNIFADARNRSAELEALSLDKKATPFLNKALSAAAPGST